MAKVFLVDGIEYLESNHRMRYNPEFHDRHGEKWDDDELAYLCQRKGKDKYADIALALGRTTGTCSDRYLMLKKKGIIEHYKNLSN